MPKYYELVPFARVLLGDLAADKYTDDTIVMALRVTTGFLQLMGYDRGHTSDFNQVTPDLNDKEKTLWGKAATVLIRNPEVLRRISEAVDIKTEEVQYDTTKGSAILQALNREDFQALQRMIYALSDGVISRRPDFGVQWGLGSPIFGRDIISD